MDIVLLTYANSQTSPLPSLGKEDDAVFSVLVNRSLKGHFFIHRDQYITLDKLNEYLHKYADQLVLFLYSGHAGVKNLSFDLEKANAKGIAHQLGSIAQKGKLKLVILNGCSTAGQVEGLLRAGVPAVVATNAPVEDGSATAFSIRFFQCLSEKRMTIRESFRDAIGPAQTVAANDLKVNEVSRSEGHFSSEIKKEEPVWGLYSTKDEILDSNPLPVRKSSTVKSTFIPNEQLTSVLFETLLEAGCSDIESLNAKEQNGDYVEMGDKQTTIVNVLPFPIAIHLQKILCPVENENEGFDKLSVARLKQIGILFQTTAQLMAIVMLAQLWELKLENKFSRVPQDLEDQLQRFFRLSSEERSVFNYLPFIRMIRQFFDSIHSGPEVIYFVEELNDLKQLLREDGDFSNACKHLYHLHTQATAGKIQDQDIVDFCVEAEENLCEFVKRLGFLHRYVMTSIQNIDIVKYRHQTSPIFKHNMVKLMRAFGKPEQSHYLLPDFLDNRGVVLLKGKVKLLNARNREFTSEHLDYLNLSPFVIDRNAFEQNTDLANLLFFDSYQQEHETYKYKNVKRPDQKNDDLEIHDDDIFKGVHLQMEAFRTTILNEST